MIAPLLASSQLICVMYIQIYVHQLLKSCIRVDIWFAGELTGSQYSGIIAASWIMVVFGFNVSLHE